MPDEFSEIVAFRYLEIHVVTVYARTPVTGNNRAFDKSQKRAVRNDLLR